MEKQIVIINGTGGSGKDTFIEFVSKYGKIVNFLYNAETEMVYDEVINFLEKNEVFE